MYEEDTSAAPEVSSGSGHSNVLRNVLLAVAVIYVAVSGYFIFEMHGRVEKLEAASKTEADSTAAHNAAIMKRLGMTEASIEQAAQQLQSKIGQTEKEVASRTSQLAKQQQASEQKLRQE